MPNIVAWGGVGRGGGYLNTSTCKKAFASIIPSSQCVKIRRNRLQQPPYGFANIIDYLMKIIVTWRVSNARSVGTSTLDPSATHMKKNYALRITITTSYLFYFLCCFLSYGELALYQISHL